MQDLVLRAAGCFAAKIRNIQVLRVVDLEGRQVIDLATIKWGVRLELFRRPQQ